MILAEYRVVLETPEPATAEQAKQILAELEHPPDQEIQSTLEWLVGNFLPIRCRVETVRSVASRRR